MSEALEQAVANELASLGYDLVECRRVGTRSRPVLDVRIDRQDLKPVTVDDCVRASRTLEARLEADALVGSERYVLEVSSPGVDRRLTRAADWQRFAGRRVSVKSAELGGRVEADLIGIDGPEGNETITVRDAAGVERRVALAQVAEARLAVHWK
jgi:ribosome maturation factor RimP